MPRERTAGESPRDGAMEVAFEQWPEPQVSCTVSANVVSTLQENNIAGLYRVSAEIFSLKLGGNTDIFALSFLAWGVFVSENRRDLV